MTSINDATVKATAIEGRSKEEDRRDNMQSKNGNNNYYNRGSNNDSSNGQGQQAQPGSSSKQDKGHCSKCNRDGDTRIYAGNCILS